MLVHHGARESVEERGAGPSGVLLLDGPPGSPFVWHQVLPILRCCGVSVATLKRGEQSNPGDATEDPFGAAADITRLLTKEEQSPAVVVGHGFNAAVALALVASAPRSAGAVVLVAPEGVLEPVRWFDRLLAAPKIGPALIWLAFRATGLALRLPPLRRRVLMRDGTEAQEAKALVRELTSGPMWRRFVARQRLLVCEVGRRNRLLRDVTAPILVLTPGGGGRRAIRFRRALQRLVPGAELITADSSNGRIAVDDPDQVVDAILLALRREYRSAGHRREGQFPRPSCGSLLDGRPDSRRPAN